MRVIWGIGPRLLVFVGGAITVTLSVFGVVAVTRIATLSRERVFGQAQASVDVAAVEIRGFFAAHGEIATAMIETPWLREWVAAHTQRRNPEAAPDPAYARVNAYFKRLVAAHPTMVDAFFASARTGEYFRSSGQLEDPGYDARTRPWWQESMQRGRLFVGSPTVPIDMKDEMWVTVESPVHGDDGELLGVAGVDLRLTTVRQVVDGITSRNQGHAFLSEGNGTVISFPEPAEVTPGQPLGDLDREAGAGGFAPLAAAWAGGSYEPRRVRWQDREWLVFSAPVQAARPQLAWNLGLMLPADLVGSPVRRATVVTLLGVLLAIILVSAVTLLVTTGVVTRPVRSLAERFADVASGRGDLTRRVEVSRRDEVGGLATAFNTFLDSTQRDMRAIGEEAAALAGSSLRLRDLADSIAAATQTSSERAQEVAASAEGVSESVGIGATASEQINASIGEISHQATQAAEVATRAVALARGARVTFESLQDVGRSVGEMVEVIEAIAAQTNLLALNATIEAARAGEAGRGFSVVADEVKTLAGQTREATGRVKEMIVSIRESTASASEAMDGISGIIDMIHETQTAIAGAVEEQSVTVAEIARSINEAARGSSGIASSMSAIAQAAQEVEQVAASTRQAAAEMDAMATRLKSVVDRFTY